MTLTPGRAWTPSDVGSKHATLPRERVLGLLGPLVLRETRLEAPTGVVQLAKGFSARVDVSGSVSVRSVPRGAVGASLFGIGLGHVQSEDEVIDARILFLVVEGPGWSHVEPVPPEYELAAREFAAAFAAAVAALDD